MEILINFFVMALLAILNLMINGSFSLSGETIEPLLQHYNLKLNELPAPKELLEQLKLSTDIEHEKSLVDRVLNALNNKEALEEIRSEIQLSNDN